MRDLFLLFFFFQAEAGIRDGHVTGVQTCALPIWKETRSEDSTAACRPTGIEMSPNVMCPLQIARIVNAPEGSYSNALANARASVLNCPESHSQTNACEQIGSVIL